MFPLLGFCTDNEAEAGACPSSAVSCGRLQGGGLVEASCLQKCSIVLKGKIKNSLYDNTPRAVTCAKWPAWLCSLKRAQSDLDSFYLLIRFTWLNFLCTTFPWPHVYICSQRHLFLDSAALVIIRVFLFYCVSGPMLLNCLSEWVILTLFILKEPKPDFKM